MTPRRTQIVNVTAPTPEAIAAMKAGKEPRAHERIDITAPNPDGLKALREELEDSKRVATELGEASAQLVAELSNKDAEILALKAQLADLEKPEKGKSETKSDDKKK